MPRTDSESVKEIIDTDLDVATIDTFVFDAADEVDERVAEHDPDYSEARLARLEKYLAAHMIRFVRDRQEASAQAGSVNVSYTGAFGSGLSATSPGQVVMMNDPEGIFGGSPNVWTRSRHARKIRGSTDDE